MTDESLVGIDNKKNQGIGASGFGLGVLGFIAYDIGILPLAALIVSGIALANFDDTQHKNRWMPVVGLIFGAIGTLLYMDAYGHT